MVIAYTLPHIHHKKYKEAPQLFENILSHLKKKL